MRRRRFLSTAAAASAAAFAAASAQAQQGPIVLRFQSAWPEKSLFHEYALAFAKKVNDMTGGDVRIEMLAAGAVVPPFGLLEAVNKGQLAGAHGLFLYQYARNSALALWGGPAFGMDANMLLAWHKYGGGRALLAKAYAAIADDVLSFPYGPMPTPPLGWFKKPVRRPEDFRGLRFRTQGMPIELFIALGATVDALAPEEIVPAMRDGVIEGAQYNNAASDTALGLPEVAKVYVQRSYHQSAEPFEILVNKTKFEALPSKMKAIVENAVEASSADLSWRAIDRYSAAYAALRARPDLRITKATDALLKGELRAFDTVLRKHRTSALFQEIEQSQRRFAERAVRWMLDTHVSPYLAYEHYFGRKKPKK